MCKGDDPTCAEFETHHRQFLEDMARQRREFLASNFAAKGGAAALAAGGVTLASRAVRPTSAPRHHQLPANADMGLPLQGLPRRRHARGRDDL